MDALTLLILAVSVVAAGVFGYVIRGINRW
jgi:hypothetical protein